MEPEKTGYFIKELRGELKMTQKELAEKLGCTDKAISRWETGKGFPDVSYLVDLAQILHVNVNELLLGHRIEKDEQKINDGLIVDTLRLSGKKQSRLKLAVLTLLCFLLLAVYYIPVAIMTPSDTMGVIFFHVLGTFLLSFAAGFVDIKIKWAFPVFAFICYCPTAAILKDDFLVVYAFVFLASGYVLMLISGGINGAVRRIAKKIASYSQKSNETGKKI